MTTRQHDVLRNSLLADGREAVAVCLCGRRSGKDFDCCSVYEIVVASGDAYIERTPSRVHWKTDFLLPLLRKAARRGLSLLKVHSHPCGDCYFSKTDDVSDLELFPSVHGWMEEDNTPQLSAVIGSDGRMVARSVAADGSFRPVSVIALTGQELTFWWSDRADGSADEFSMRTAQAFGRGTTDLLRRLSVAVVGCSGTGSIVVEQLARLGLGKLLLVDPDCVEHKNLNRILNATLKDAESARPKVDVLASAIQAMGLGTKVETHESYLGDAVEAVAECDIVFGCVDTAEGRHMLNRLAAFYCLPYFDVGVRLDADGSGGIKQICGTTHYLQPGGSTLLSRGAITVDQIRAENIRRSSPEEYERLEKEKYIIGVNEDRPAVISVNMLFGALVVNEFLARLHSYRLDGNDSFASHGLSLTHDLRPKDPDGEPCESLLKYIGRGDLDPLLDMPALSLIAPEADDE